MSDVAAAMQLLMARLAATEAQWREEKERADEAERGEREAWRQTDEVRRERDEARAEVERLRADERYQRLAKERAEAALAASQAREKRLRALLESCLINCDFGMRDLEDRCRAALAEEGP